MPQFQPAFFSFLRDLAAHNDREWFQANKARYEREVKAPLAAFVEALAPRLAAVDPAASVSARSIFRIHRDTRFSADKSPYKTNAGAHFPLAPRGEEDVHRPGYYLHLQPGASFAGAGLWRPDAPALGRIRASIDQLGARWAELRASLPPLSGESLVRVPRGFAPDHPHAEDLRRKDFCVGIEYTEEVVCAPDFLDRFVGDCARVRPLVAFLAEAVA